MELSGRRILVLGAGLTGTTVAGFAQVRGAVVTVNDSRPAWSSDTIDALRGCGVRFVFGGLDAGLLHAADLVVISPGIASPGFLEGVTVPVWSEVELASRFLVCPLVAVTGTNGKSTVVTLVARMLQHSGKTVFLGGNLGRPLLEAVDENLTADDVAVAEVSSFQLERVDRFRAKVACVLNVSEDHLDRYRDFAAYVHTKGRVFCNQGPDDHAVLPADDARLTALCGTGRLHRFGDPDGAVRVRDGRIEDGVSGLSVPVREVPMQGEHNLVNACAAVLLARLAGATTAAMGEALRSFSGLPHRMERVGQVDGVEYVNDSKATNVGAAVAAIRGVRPGQGRGRVLVIAGGKDKGGDHGALFDAVMARGGVMVTLGEAGPILAKGGRARGVRVSEANGLAHAVQLSRDLAQPGDVVLLAPACASYDMFRSFEHRGEVFREQVLCMERES